MATFECKVYRLEIEPHPNADRLELAKVGDYRSIVGKGLYKTGDLGVYIPEAALVPEWLLKRMGLEGKLAGKQHNRVKAAKFRGVLSQGLVCGAEFRDENPVEEPLRTAMLVYLKNDEKHSYGYIAEGEDATEFLGIEKYEPTIPSCMRGEVHNAFTYTLKYDIENLKKHPDVFQEGEPIVITEKIHGTWTCFGYHPEFEEKERYLVTSKGLAEGGLAFKLNEANHRNLYLRALEATVRPDAHLVPNNVIDRLRELLLVYSGLVDVPVYILGETYGPGVQKKFHYGLLKPSFRVFDIYVGAPKTGKYLPPADVRRLCYNLQIETVPVLYEGPYSKAVVDEYTSGGETVSGKEDNIREGVVIRPATERTDPRIQAQDSSTPERVILKSVSEAYLLQKGGTEYT